MIVHIVMFKFDDNSKKENILKAKEMLNFLMGKVPSLQSMEVGENFCDEDRAMDLSIITTFKDKNGLNEYATHPVHLKVVEFIKEVAILSKVVDYQK